MERSSRDNNDSSQDSREVEIPREVEGAEQSTALSPVTEKNVSEPAEGGFFAWLQVIGAHFLVFNSWGLVNTFGTYQSYYETALSQSPSQISWIGTTQGFLLILVGIFAGPVYDYGYLTLLVVTGGLCVSIGLMLTSIATQYWHFFLAQGVLTGIGAGCVFVPSVAIVSSYFTKKRATVIGLSASGGSVGGIIFPIVFRQLEPTIGFGWATRVIGFMSFVMLTFSASVLRMRTAPAKKRRSLLDLRAFKQPSYTLFSFGMLFSFVGLYFPFFYIPSYAAQKLDTESGDAFYILSIMNAGSVLGRVLPGLLGDQIGAHNTLLPCTIATAGLAFGWIGIHSLSGLIAFAAFYGFFSGALVSLPATVIAQLCKDPTKIGTMMGMCFSFAGVGLLIGSPFAGAILGDSGGSYLGGQIFCGSTIIIGAGLWLLVWLRRQRQQPTLIL